MKITLLATALGLLSGAITSSFAQDFFDVDELMSRNFDDDVFDTYAARSFENDHHYPRVFDDSETNLYERSEMFKPWGSGKYVVDGVVYEMAVKGFLHNRFRDDYGPKYEKACGRKPVFHVEQNGHVYPTLKSSPTCNKKHFSIDVSVTLPMYVGAKIVKN